ncbi:hypothetical protein BYT27DRAFT_7252631 [Phlegmacium glaucopus]|nr:hypothetical protein BYT27DRAFT_7252631 [Phlegmacium glaucopus]
MWVNGDGLWRKISFYVCVPAIAICVAWAYNAEAEHSAHVEHIKEESGGVLPDAHAHDAINRRTNLTLGVPTHFSSALIYVVDTYKDVELDSLCKRLFNARLTSLLDKPYSKRIECANPIDQQKM